MNHRLGVTTLVGLALFLTTATGQQPAPRQQFVPGEVIVKFDESADENRRSAILSSASVTVLHDFKSVDIQVLRLPPGQTVERGVAALQSTAGVAKVQPNYMRFAVAPPPPNDPKWLDNTLWGLVRIQAQQAWTTFTTGAATVVVADIDTGVNYNHEDLNANMWRNPGETAGNGIDDDSNGYIDDVFGINATINGVGNPARGNPMDDNGHGTHVAGTIAGVGNNGIGVVGVTWNSKILACKFMDSTGSGFDDDAIECLNYVVALKQRGINIRVTNSSWGGSDGAPTLQAAFDAAGSLGILNVCAAGNDNSNNDFTPFYPASFNSPSIVSVAASDQSDNRAGFSNYGATSVDLAAPGVSIYSTVGSSYGYASGTSMASPHVAGAAALLVAVNPSLTRDAIKSALMSNVDLFPQWSGLVVSGGRLNVFRAAQAIAGSGGGTSAAYLRTDATTQGNWAAGGYGEDGYNIITDTVNYPAYAQVTPAGHQIYTWASSTPDVRGLLRAGGGSRLAATWYAGAFDITINLTDGLPHEVAFYCVDWDTTTRSQRFDVFDAIGGTLLATHTISGFNGGQYVVLRLQGHVRVRLTLLSGVNAVVSGVFFDPDGGGNPPPSVALTNPGEGDSFPAPASITVDATASDDSAVLQVEFFANNTSIGVDTTSSYSILWPNVPAGLYTLKAVATDDDLVTTTSAEVHITVTGGGGGGASAAYLRTDATTQGNWAAGGYGEDGYNIITDTVNYPTYAQVTPAGNSTWTWTSSTPDVRGLLRAGGGGRLAATWYAGAFDITINLIDGLPHEVAFYCVDWDTTTRSQRLDVFDAIGGTLLATQTIGGFNGGQYVVFRLQGHVRVRLTMLTGVNAVVSGLFFDPDGGGGPPPPPSGSAAYLRTDATTQGNWTTGGYGGDGYNIITDTVNYPTYAQVTPAGNSTWTWTSSTPDVRGLLRAGGGGRLAATWYGAAFDITINLIDGLPHEVAFYCVDWDTTARSQRFDVFDAASGTSLATHSISGFNGGQYVVFRLQGHVRVRLTLLSGVNAVVSGLFFDPDGGLPPMELTPRPAALEPMPPAAVPERKH